MRVALLGHRGFVGSAFAAYLRAINCDVVGIDRSTYGRYRRQGADVVINAAGSSDRRLAETSPLESFQANVELTLASLTDFPTDLYIYLSTVGVYPDRTDTSLNSEDAKIDPTRLSAYGLFKLMGEMIVASRSPKWLIARLGPMVGPSLRKNSVYDLLEQRTLFFHPDTEMPYIHTHDVARIVWELRSSVNDIFNVCGDRRVKLRALAAEVGVELPSRLDALPHDDWDVNISKLKTRLAVPDSWTTVREFIREWRPPQEVPMPGPM